MKCRHCGAPLTLRISRPGRRAAVERLSDRWRVQAPEVWLPLRLMVCETCWLVQTLDYAPQRSACSPETMPISARFRRRGWSIPSLCDGDDLAVRARMEFDGLRGRRQRRLSSAIFQADGVPCYGVEPTASTAEAARAKGIEIVSRSSAASWPERSSNEGRSADLTAANNVLAHVPDINDFVGGFSMSAQAGRRRRPSSFLIVVEMARNNQFDTAYHEHYSYLSLTAVARIFAEQRSLGLRRAAVADPWRQPSGLCAAAGQRRRPVEPSVAALAGVEDAAGMRDAGFLRLFQGRAETHQGRRVCVPDRGEAQGHRGRRLRRRREGQHACSISAASSRRSHPLCGGPEPGEARPSSCPAAASPLFRRAG